MYLAYPSQDNPSRPAFMAHVKRLNEEADVHTYYKIVYIMRPAHKTNGDTATLDPSIDSTGEQECIQLVDKFTHAMQTKGIPPAEVIVTSPLARALRTTQLGVAPLFPSIFPAVLKGPRERLDGKEKNKRHSKEWIEQTFATFRTENVDADDILGSRYVKSAEPYEDLWRRVQGVFNYIFESFPDALVIALMSHCYVEQTIQREITGWDVPESEQRDKVEFYVGDARVYAIIVKGVREE